MDNSTFDFHKNKTLSPNPNFLKIAGKLPEFSIGPYENKTKNVLYNTRRTTYDL